MENLDIESATKSYEAQIAVVVWCILDKVLRGATDKDGSVSVSIEEVEASIEDTTIRTQPPTAFEESDVRVVRNRLKDLGIKLKMPICFKLSPRYSRGIRLLPFA
jgi:subtilase family serine protease